jgi:hypothetical protein
MRNEPLEAQLKNESDGDGSTRGRPRLAVLVAVEALESRRLLTGDVILHWNEIIRETLIEQPPPRFAPRDLAVVHVAMFDAVNSIDESYEPYIVDVRASRSASKEAAAAQAAHDVMVALFPSRQAVFDEALAEDLADIPASQARQGAAVGEKVARLILALRADDGVNDVETYTPPSDDPGQWQPTPPNFLAAGAVQVGSITPFVIEDNAQFRPDPPPALTSEEYAADYNEVKEIGSVDSTVRTDEQTLTAMLWFAPVTNAVAWNQIAQNVAEDRDTSLVENARAFALLNIGLIDSLITSYASKFEYALWRPVTAIQRGDEDGNPATEGDPDWMTLHPTTPPYPTYPGNAATQGAVGATILADVFGEDEIQFEVDWSEFGFPDVTRSYESFWAAAEEQARSRIYGGVHFEFDTPAGQAVGRDVGQYILENALEPEDDLGKGHGREHAERDRDKNGGRAVTFGASGHRKPTFSDTRVCFSDASDNELFG